jgi:uncharacterized membrane protein YtjA (UPF0391 family)
MTLAPLFPVGIRRRDQTNVAVGGAKQKVDAMLRWALIFFIIALVAAFFGFGGMAGLAADIGKFLFVAFLIVAAIALISGLASARGP